MIAAVEFAFVAMAFVVVWLGGLHFLVSRRAERTERATRRRWWGLQ